ncbi:hypothetical protein [Bartonella tribocorum]|uniref:Integrase n=1 Tax=Bartonella tribocorum (strain DSM 28219 / CCUG 45778 / CIP 105476 / IBS 506) TaxID=382640 RepID=A9IWX6_BART1
MCDGASLLFHKRKDGGAQWIAVIPIHDHHHAMKSAALRDVSLRNNIPFLYESNA